MIPERTTDAETDKRDERKNSNAHDPKRMTAMESER